MSGAFIVSLVFSVFCVASKNVSEQSQLGTLTKEYETIFPYLL